MSTRLTPRPFPFPLHIGTDICKISRIHKALFPDTHDRSRPNGRIRSVISGETELGPDAYTTEDPSPNTSSDRRPFEHPVQAVNRRLNDKTRFVGIDNEPPNFHHFPLLHKIMYPDEQFRFYKRVQTHFDSAADGISSMPSSHRHAISVAVAGMWAIKEAAIKAVKPRRIYMKAAEVFWDEEWGWPYVVVKSMSEDVAGQVARVSLSHEAEYAVASVLAVEDHSEVRGDVGGEAAARAESGVEGGKAERRSEAREANRRRRERLRQVDTSVREDVVKEETGQEARSPFRSLVRKHMVATPLLTPTGTEVRSFKKYWQESRD